jgi:hypothetical protein
MSRWSIVLVLGVALSGLAGAGAPPELTVQGTYQGTWKDAKNEGKLEADVIALGNDTYKAYLRQYRDTKLAARAELDGKADGGKVAFEGKNWKGEWANARITGAYGEGVQFALERLVKEPPTLGKEPPEGAVVFLDGKSFVRVIKRDRADWKLIGEGGIEVPRGGIRTKEAFEGSFDCHIEFRCNFKPAARGQGRGNSGFYLPNGSEIQVLDNFGFEPYKGSCGAIYGQKPPDENASLPPMQWQTYDVEYRTKSKRGKKTGKPWVTVYHNGIKIHDGVELRRPLREGQFRLQDHGNPVGYRNFWLVVVEGK